MTVTADYINGGIAPSRTNKKMPSGKDFFIIASFTILLAIAAHNSLPIN